MSGELAQLILLVLFAAYGLVLLRKLLERMNHMSTQLDAAIEVLRQQVEAATTVDQSAITLIQGLVERLAQAANANDPGLVLDLASKLQTSTNALAAALTANTPAAPAPAPDTSGGGLKTPPEQPLP